MRNVFTDILAQMRGIWARLDAGQRLVVSAVLVATIAGLGGVVWFAGRPSYETVFSPKNADEVSRVQQALQSAQISFNIGDDGRSILVDRNKVGAANLAITGAGLTGTQMPTIGGGTSLIEDADTKAYRLDLASVALAKSAIMGLEGVLDATVTASRPRRAVAFRDREEEQKPTATVMLRLRQGVPFDGLAASAADLVAAQLMVPLKNITVVSASGGQRWRYDPDRNNGGGSSDNFLSLQQRLSDDRTAKAQERLDQLWPGKTSVAVTIELDPQWEIRSEKVLPDGKIVRSEKTSKDSAPAGGSGSAATAQAADASGRKNETLDREFVTEIGERRTGRMMPDIKRMSVAVIYDASLAQTTGFNPKDLENTVKTIVGWDPSRDQPESFSSMTGTFVPVEPVVAETTGPGMLDKLQRWGPTIGQVLGVFVVVLFLRGLFKRAPKAVPAEAAAVAGAAPKVEVDESALPPEELQKRMRREIERTIANDPAALAKLLETWLTEQKA